MKLSCIFPNSIFEIIGTHSLQSGMKSIAVIEHLNLVDDICLGFFSGQIMLLMSAFSLLFGSCYMLSQIV